MAKSPPAISRHERVGRRGPRRRARRGRAASSPRARGSARRPGGGRRPGAAVVEALVGQHAVDDVPARQRRGVVTARRSSRARARGPGPRARRGAGCRPSPASARRRSRRGRTRRLGGEEQVAAQRRARTPRSGRAPWAAKTVGKGSASSARGSWRAAAPTAARPPPRSQIASNTLTSTPPRRRGPRRGGAPRAAGRRRGRRPRPRSPSNIALVEQVERRRGERHDGERAVALGGRARPLIRVSSARGRGDLVGVAGPGHPRQPQRVVGVARDHVQVEVEDGLPGRGAAASSGG